MPEIVRAAASPFEHVGQFTVLNGAQGVTSALAEIIQQAGALTAVARRTLAPAITAAGEQDNNGSAKPAAARPAPAKAPAPAATKPAPAPKQAAAPAVPAADAGPADAAK
jgi:hypothetical protein